MNIFSRLEFSIFCKHASAKLPQKFDHHDYEDGEDGPDDDESKSEDEDDDRNDDCDSFDDFQGNDDNDDEKQVCDCQMPQTFQFIQPR